MREIEILVPLKTEIGCAREILSGFEDKGSKRTIDTYYVDPLRKNLQMDVRKKLMECCRLREKGGKAYVTYKIDHYDGETWTYSEEHETEIRDLAAMREVFTCLGLEELVTVDNTKHAYIAGNYEIVIEDVQELGCFLEVEILQDDESRPVPELKAGIWRFIQNLGLDVGEELNSGKPELLLNKRDN